jgi:pyruvate dehydrogenase E1 component alpha subunit
VDGNDVLACLAVTRKAMQAAREGQGPTLIEAYTYRMGAHTTTDDPTRYRLSAELEAWKLKDPIERVKQYLIRTWQTEMSFFDEVEAEAAEVGVRVRRACLEMPDPQPLSMFDNVFTSETRQLAAERAEFAAYLDSFVAEEAAR